MELFTTAEDHFQTVVASLRRTYHVRATITGALDRETGVLDGTGLLQNSLRRICSELNGKLDAQVIEGGFNTAESIAARILALLSSDCPGLIRVEVKPLGDAVWAAATRTPR